MKASSRTKAPAASGVTLDPQGYFSRGGRRIVPVGVNYWPASCGVEMWQAWPEKEMQHDLDVIRGLGLNCIRFFLRWPDFEPELGRYDETMFKRLAKFMRWCGERQILAHPSLVVGFMSGGHFWPKGKDQRNLYADPVMLKGSADYCRKAAATLAPFHADILALDLGNELGCADAWGAPPAAIRNWCDVVTAAIREAYPRALIVSGTDSGVVTVDYGWRLDAQPGTDFYSVHTYPVPGWNVVPFDGMTDPLCQTILPFCTLLAKAFGPVMVQEFSSILMHGRPECDSYLNAILPACLENGANGFLWWCLRDIHANLHPYIKCGLERRLGLVDARDQIKPSLQGTVDFFRSLNDWAPPQRDAPELALYWPAEYYRRDNDKNPGNDPSTQFRRMLITYYLLKATGCRVGIVRGDRPLTPALKTLVITGAALTTVEADRVAAWVRRGGRVLWSGPSWAQWTATYDALVGAQPVDIRFPKPVTVECFGSSWTLAHFPAEGRVAARVTSARVVAASADNDPVVLANTLGKGKVVTVLPVAEDTIVGLTADRPARDRWREWFKGLLKELAAKA